MNSWQIDAAFPGGNIIVDRLDSDSADVRQDLRDTEGWWFWWQFRVTGAQGRTLTFRHTCPQPSKNRRFPYGRRGPAVGLDGGLTWSWLGADAANSAGEFRYAFGPEATEARFAFAQPYVEEDLQRFLARHNSPALVQAELCRSPKGRVVPRLHAGCVAGRPEFRVLITARNHACESLANFVIEGMIDAVLEDSELGAWFRRRVEAMVIPFMDRDGVEAGDQGKNRRPHDHNRDYSGTSLYPETAALRQFAPAWLGGLPCVALDLHCPSPMDGVIYVPGSADPARWEKQCRFSRLLESAVTKPLVYQGADNLPFGQRWNVAGNFAQGSNCSGWAAGLPGIALATSEFPYADVKGVAVTADLARLFGRSLAGALRRYLETIA